jgi:hypothetical protein
MDAMFPTLTPPQMARVTAHGRGRRVEEGEVLVEVGDEHPKRSSPFIGRAGSPAR